MALRQSILLVEDDKVLNQLMGDQLRRMGYDVVGVADWAGARDYLSGHEPSLVLLDCRLPDADGLDVLTKLKPSSQPVVMLTAYGSVQHAVRAMQTGAAEYLVKPVNLDELELVVKRTLERAALRRDCKFLRKHLKSHRERFMVGGSPALTRVHKLIKAVAPSDMTVLIQGESGVGKELVAHEIHLRSERQKRNFIALDCCSLQENLFESELFGHERGAFTGAHKQKKGLVELASGGTVFLDEIGEISPAIQAKLLRVLETGSFRRLGGTKDLYSDVRVVAATNRDLETLSKQGKFRADLYYRLSAFVVPVPPLRERIEDIPDLVRHFVHHHDFSRRIQKQASAAAIAQLKGYPWPGNIRELKNIVERAIILSGDQSEIGVEHLTFRAPALVTAEPEGDTTTLRFDDEPTLEEIQARYLRQLLARYEGHRAKVAGILGISVRNTYRLIRKYGL